MDNTKLLSLYIEDPRTGELSRLLKTDDPSLPGTGDKKNPLPGIQLKGIVGSSKAFVSVAVFTSVPGLHFHILPDKESAAYFYNDLEQILNDRDVETEKKQVLFFPSSFKKTFDSGQKDNLGLLSRTEILNRLHSRSRKFIIVTYPEALSEKVVNKKFLEKNTLKLKSGEAVSLEFVLDLLIEYEFERADFVIEPGQFSLRGGLIDVYSFSGDHPYRIEFEGDNVASIRTFDPTNQLSIEKKEEISIIPDIRINRERLIKYDSLFSFLPENTVIWSEDIRYTADILDKNEDTNLFLPGQEFLDEIGRFRLIEFGKNFYSATANPIRYSMSPQPSFNKNFELLFADLQQNDANGLKNILLADNPKQAERLISLRRKQMKVKMFSLS